MLIFDLCVWLRADQFPRHYWKTRPCSSFGWPVFFWSSNSRSINELQLLVIANTRINADLKPPPLFCVREQLAGAYLPDLAWRPHKWANWLTLNGELRGHSERPLRAMRCHIRSTLPFSSCYPLLERQDRQCSTVAVSLHVSGYWIWLTWFHLPESRVLGSYRRL